ncbi:MAG: hypothetical protein ACJAYU_000848 [Bradymonadia bacterium]|jgi:hypothetical protein
MSRLSDLCRRLPFDEIAVGAGQDSGRGERECEKFSEVSHGLV